MKNQLFNPHRFCLLLQRTWVEDWKQSPYRSIALPVLFIFLWVSVPFYFKCTDCLRSGGEEIVLHVDPDFWVREQGKLLERYAGMFGFVMLYFVLQTVKWLNAKKTMITQLMLPASTLEKHLCMLCVLALSSFVFFPMAVWVSEVLRVGICLALFPSLHIPWIDLSLLWGRGLHEVFSTSATFLNTIAAIWMLGSMMFFGSMLFRKSSVIKSILAMTGIILLYSWITYQWGRLLFPGNGEFGRTLNNPELQNTWLASLMNQEEFLSGLILFFMLYFFVLGYYRMKELELLKRW